MRTLITLWATERVWVIMAAAYVMLTKIRRGGVLKNNVEVLLNLREKFLDLKTFENQRELASKAFVSMVEKTFNNGRSLEILKGFMPNFQEKLVLKNSLTPTEYERNSRLR